jgi:hypothetical protein
MKWQSNIYLNGAEEFATGREVNQESSTKVAGSQRRGIRIMTMVPNSTQCPREIMKEVRR